MPLSPGTKHAPDSTPCHVHIRPHYIPTLHTRITHITHITHTTRRAYKLWPIALLQRTRADFVPLRHLLPPWVARHNFNGPLHGLPCLSCHVQLLLSHSSILASLSLSVALLAFMDWSLTLCLRYSSLLGPALPLLQPPVVWSLVNPLTQATHSTTRSRLEPALKAEAIRGQYQLTKRYQRH